MASLTSIPTLFPSPDIQRMGETKAQLTQRKDILTQSQKAYERTIQNRSCIAQTSSCCLCPCTCTTTILCLIFCYPCICYKLLYKSEDCFTKSLQSMGCVLFERPPNNSCELCCTYCTPMYADFPDPNHQNGRNYYALPHERRNEELRIQEILQLGKIIKAQEIIDGMTPSFIT